MQTRRPVPSIAYLTHHHAGDCDFQLDQYPQECTCGATELYQRLAERVCVEDIVEVTKWRPMWSAPRDGSPILLLTNTGMVSAWYQPGWWDEVTPLHEREYNGAQWICYDDAFQIEVEETPTGYIDGSAIGWMEEPT